MENLVYSQINKFACHRNIRNLDNKFKALEVFLYVLSSTHSNSPNLFKRFSIKKICSPASSED